MLDLVLTKIPNLVRNVHVTEPFGSSDHNIVEFTMVCKTEYTDWKNDYCDYRNGDYVGMKEYLRHIDLRSKLSRANCSTEEAWTILKASIEEAVSKFVPKKVRRKRSNKPLWWNKEIYRARKNRLRWWDRYKQTKIHQDYRQFKRAERKASRLVRQPKRKLEEKIADKMKQDPKFFYKYARSQLKVKETVTPIEDEQGNIVINDNLKTATTFNNHFVTQFSQENLHIIPNQVKMFQGSSEEELNSITFEESSICNKLKKLNASKSPGTDKIFPIVLNRCAEELAGPLNALFTKN